MTCKTVGHCVTASLLFFATACGALDVSDPTAVEDSELNNAAGADLLRTNAISQLFTAAAYSARYGGVLTDEFLADPPAYYAQYNIVSDLEMLDRRESARAEAAWGGQAGIPYAQFQRVRYMTSVAIPKIRLYSSADAANSFIGEMLAARGFAELSLAETVCPGFPLHDVVAYKPLIGDPLTADEALARALVTLDSALVYAADSARVLDFVRVARGRVLLDLGRYDEAAAAVADVPTVYKARAEFGGTNESYNAVAVPALYGELTFGVANAEGNAGLDFVAAADPRLPTDSVGVANDGVTVMYAPRKYAALTSSFVYASGIEARLIEAEAALHNDDPTWLLILNQLRDEEVVPAMSALPNPDTEAARVDLLFRERAFWLFGTGHRLGDIRRLVSRYGRSADALLPTGPYRLGGAGYGTAMSVPFGPTDERTNNPAVTGCTAR